MLDNLRTMSPYAVSTYSLISGFLQIWKLSSGFADVIDKVKVILYLNGYLHAEFINLKNGRITEDEFELLIKDATLLISEEDRGEFLLRIMFFGYLPRVIRTYSQLVVSRVLARVQSEVFEKIIEIGTSISTTTDPIDRSSYFAISLHRDWSVRRDECLSY